MADIYVWLYRMKVWTLISYFILHSHGVRKITSAWLFLVTFTWKSVYIDNKTTRKYITQNISLYNITFNNDASQKFPSNMQRTFTPNYWSWYSFQFLLFSQIMARSRKCSQQSRYTVEWHVRGRDTLQSGSARSPATRTCQLQPCHDKTVSLLSVSLSVDMYYILLHSTICAYILFLHIK